MNILFIGNSYTFYNDMPSMLAGLAEENGVATEVDSLTKGGRKLYENLKEGDALNARLSELTALKHYDVLILQEQSYFALVDYEKFKFGLRGLSEAVGADRTILYSTWGRREGCPLLEELNMTSRSMTEALHSAYSNAASEYGFGIAPVGMAYLSMKEASSDVELYHPDASHPSYTGSALAATVIYKTVFGEMPTSHASLAVDERTYSAFIAAIE